MASLRKIVHIDEEKCNGCGLCVPSCAEGALKIIDGKARLVSEIYCDGLGACLGKCPQDAITVEEREAEEFDEKATHVYLEMENLKEEETACGSCASANTARFIEGDSVEESSDYATVQSQLGHWPVQLTLVPPNAPFFKDADLVIGAHCTGFAYPNLHRDFLKDHALIIACPKLDNAQAHLEKLTEVLKQSSIKSIKVLRMEVPCCSGLVQLTKMAVKASGKDIPVEEMVIGVGGEVLSAV